jgi:endonuclease/exonuclease/phosphatase (EEP) superfamily protein YafD
MRRPLTTAIVGRLLVLGGIGSLAGYLGPWYWGFELAAHFRYHYFWLFSIALILAVVTRRTVLVVLSGFALVASTLPLFPLYVPSSGVQAAGRSDTLTIVSYNARASNAHYDPVGDFVDAIEADLFLLVEASKPMIDALQLRLQNWMVAARSEELGLFGVAVLARNERPASSLDAVRTYHLGDEIGNVGVSESLVEFAGERARVIAIHLYPPIGATMATMQDRQFIALAEIINAEEMPTIVCGDLNATPWDSRLRQLQKQTGLRNSQRGYGYSATWPAFLPRLMGIPIDHCLHTDDFVIVHREMLAANGSDHRPLQVEFAWR